MKARFRFVMKRMKCQVDNACLAIHACCIINNICEHFGDVVFQQWCSEVEATTAVYDQPQHTTDAAEGTGRAVRDALVEFCRQ
ncbi:hypothetical protein HPB48_023653 [Haemaphysalis longicornis]|uniref:DDE Tnp4 domain-containing protein n=1 Tax=Haemaphysalis longicornis TaxID=44386 RepID=A0A9J6GWY0_HAELO|nr:hypothetical protein HPB48_023653 [Haemaphysalis longicornis]